MRLLCTFWCLTWHFLFVLEATRRWERCDNMYLPFYSYISLLLWTQDLLVNSFQTQKHFIHMTKGVISRELCASPFIGCAVEKEPSSWVPVDPIFFGIYFLRRSDSWPAGFNSSASGAAPLASVPAVAFYVEGGIKRLLALVETGDESFFGFDHAVCVRSPVASGDTSRRTDDSQRSRERVSRCSRNDSVVFPSQTVKWSLVTASQIFVFYSIVDKIYS